MKQHIEKSQWDELSYKQKKTFVISIYSDCSFEYFEDCFDEYGYVNIGQMVEFLGDDMMTIDLLEDNFFSVETMPMIAEETFTLFEKSNLCDALWEACVYKLKQ